MADYEFAVDEQMQGQRLDKLVIERLGGTIGRGAARALFESGAVRVDGRRVAKGRLARLGEHVSVAFADEGPPVVPEPDMALDVRLERADLVVVCKPAGMPTAPLRGGETGTIANALIGRYPDMVSVGSSEREPGLLHRLDSGTSGLIVAARTTQAFAVLAEALRQGQLCKKYWLICQAADLAASGVIELPLCSHPKDSRRVMACVHPRDVERYSPRPASTAYRVIEQVGSMAWVEAVAARAARHQLRVHFAAIGHPLIGDGLYGGDTTELQRQALHAYYVSFKGTADVAGFEVETTLPDDLQRLLDSGRR